MHLLVVFTLINSLAAFQQMRLLVAQAISFHMGPAISQSTLGRLPITLA